MQNKVGFTFFRNVEHEVNIKKKNILAYGLSGQEKIRTPSLETKTECSYKKRCVCSLFDFYL